MVGKVLLGLLLLVVFLCWVPVGVRVSYRSGEVTAVLKWLFLHFKLFPPQEAKPGKKKAKKEAKPQEQEPKPPKKKNHLEFLWDILQLVNDTLPHAGRALGHFLKHTTLKKCRLNIVVAQEDAADTAIRYGQFYAALYNVYVLASSMMRVHQFCLNISPDYTSGPEAEKVDAQLLFTFRPGTALMSGLIFIFHGGRVLLQSKLIAGEKKANAGPAKASPTPRG